VIARAEPGNPRRLHFELRADTVPIEAERDETAEQQCGAACEDRDRSRMAFADGEEQRGARERKEDEDGQ